MSEKIEIPQNDVKKPNLRLHPMKTEEKLDSEDTPETSESRIRKGVGKILTRRHPHEFLYLCSGEGLRFAYLRHGKNSAGRHIVWLLFKRTQEMRPYYLDIRKWCDESNLSYSDKSHSNEKYISVELESNIDGICAYIASLRHEVFKFKNVLVGSRQAELSLALSNINQPIILAFFGLSAALGLGLLPLYEMFKIRTLGRPSLQAIDWPEIFLFTLIALGVFSVRYLNKTEKNKVSKTKGKMILGRTIILFFIALAFFTY